MPLNAMSRFATRVEALEGPHITISITVSRDSSFCSLDFFCVPQSEYSHHNFLGDNIKDLLLIRVAR